MHCLIVLKYNLISWCIMGLVNDSRKGRPQVAMQR